MADLVLIHSTYLHPIPLVLMGLDPSFIPRGTDVETSTPTFISQKTDPANPTSPFPYLSGRTEKGGLDWSVPDALALTNQN